MARRLKQNILKRRRGLSVKTGAWDSRAIARVSIKGTLTRGLVDDFVIIGNEFTLV